MRGAGTLLNMATILLGSGLGVLLGGMASWLAQGKHRRAERRYRREASRLRATVEAGESAGERGTDPRAGVTGLPALMPSR